MKGKTVFMKMTDISDRFLEEAAFVPQGGRVLAPPPRRRRENWLTRFANSGWGVACICFVVAVAAVAGMVAWGRMGSHTPPVVGTNTIESDVIIPPDFGPLPAEIEREIIQKYIQENYEKYDGSITEEDVSLRYYGCYGNGKTYIMFVDVEGWAYITAQSGLDEVNGLRFTYPTSQKLLVYRDGFWSLTEAYKKGYLSDNDLTILHRLYIERKKNSITN